MMLEDDLSVEACEGPIGGIASLHVDAAGPNFLAQGTCGFVDAGENKSGLGRSGISRDAHGGRPVPLPSKSGLGVDISEALKRYPFQGTRPFAMAVHEDGAVASI